jgi:hypothetical protein
LVIGALFSHLVPITLFFFIIAIVMVVLTDIELGIISAQVFVLAGIAAIAMSMLAARLILIYPATLARKTISIASAWRLSRDHFTRLLLVWAFATVPFRLAYRLSDIASQHIWHNLPDAVFLKTLIYLGVVILPTTLSVLGQIIVTFVALTITYNCLVAAER